MSLKTTQRANGNLQRDLLVVVAAMYSLVSVVDAARRSSRSYSGGSYSSYTPTTYYSYNRTYGGYSSNCSSYSYNSYYGLNECINSSSSL